jgi:histidine triad (HIT) family protein
MNDCIFCKIINKEIPAEINYEDDEFIGFLDIKPIEKGHTLLIPKKHYPWMQDLPDEMLAQIFILAKKIMAGMVLDLSCKYVEVKVVGKDVPHFHIHLIPRYE